MSEFRRVYQSGHTDTWCDGKTHLHTSGGFVWPDNKEPPAERQEYPCDCAYWAQFNARVA